MKDDSLMPYLPGNIGRMTINELLQSDDTEIEKKGRKLKVRRSVPGGTICFEHTKYDDGDYLSVSGIHRKRKKKELASTVKQMRNEGMTYQEISRRTGMSTTYARRLYLDE